MKTSENLFLLATKSKLLRVTSEKVDEVLKFEKTISSGIASVEPYIYFAMGSRVVKTKLEWD